jgi:hypothetical protein
MAATRRLLVASGRAACDPDLPLGNGSNRALECDEKPWTSSRISMAVEHDSSALTGPRINERIGSVYFQRTFVSWCFRFRTS